MVVSIHQPNYLPWLGFFHKMSQCDVFVLLDNVQFAKHMFQNRTRIKTAQGESWLTVPVLTKGHFGELISEVRIDSKVNWRKKHFGTLQTNYDSAPYFKNYSDWFRNLYAQDWDKLSDLNITIIKYLASKIGIKTKIVIASSLGVLGARTELLLNICKFLNADVYLAGPSGKKYLDAKLFKDGGIDVLYHKFNHPLYEQQFGEFISRLSAIDLLFNCGEDSHSILVS